jgi:hypothetical protein
MNLLLIHGRAQEGKDPVRLQEVWEQALADGLRRAGLSRPAGVRVLFPFYGDELDRLVRELDKPLLAEAVARGEAPDTKELEFRADLLREMVAHHGISEQAIEAHFEGEPREKGPLNWKWVHAILRTLDRTPLGDPTIDRFTRDVFVYLTYPTVARRINDVVEKELTPGKWVVVAHSLGTVVGYNVLRAVAPTVGVEVVRYVTVGSPLAVRAIRKRLAAPLEMPKCVGHWYNALDPRDVVALYPLDGRNFDIQPPIENKSMVDNFTENRHGIAGYLNDADVARKIVEAIAA